MTAYSCYVGVDAAQGEDYGAVASLSYRPNGGIDIMPGPFACQITEDAATIVRPGATLVMTLADQTEVTLATIAEWLRTNKGATMLVDTYQVGPAIDPETGFRVTLGRPGKSDLVGMGIGSIGLAFADAVK